MVNSIISNIDKNNIISQIRLILGANKNYICLIVEGDCDEQAFGHLFNSNVFLFQSFSGKEGLEEIVSFFKYNKRVIGVRDRDYTTKRLSTRIFFPDYCCLEMMIVSIPCCFERLIIQYYRGGVPDCDKILLSCLQHIEALSRLRKLNEKRDIGINFNGISIVNDFHYDFDAMNNAIMSDISTKNPSLDFKRYEYLFNAKPCNDVKELLYISNGHDFVDVFFAVCSKSNKKKISKTLIEASMRSCFGKTEFQTTGLYNNLNQYQQKHNIVLF